MSSSAAARVRRVDVQTVAIVTTPGGADRHVHCALVDEDGNGRTSAAPDGHFHLIHELVVHERLGHGHDFSGRRCSESHGVLAQHLPRRPNASHG